MSPIPILLDHAGCIVVNKPAGVPMHDPELGIVNRLKNQLGLSQLHLCHRLDTGTSGCLCLAKSANIAAHVGEAFANRQVEKHYIALTCAKPKKKQGTIAGDMKNRRKGQHILTKTLENPAVTQFFSEGVEPGIRACLVKPLTGKTHQIRVALKSVGAPILGDTLYGGVSSDRMYLHAYQLSLPLNQDQLCVTAIPESGHYFQNNAFTQWLQHTDSPQSRKWPTISSSLMQKVTQKVVSL